MKNGQIQVIKVDHYAKPAEGNKAASDSFSYLFIVKENPADLSDWGYQDSWRMRNPAPDEVLEEGCCYDVRISRAMEMVGGYGGDKDIRAVNNYAQFKKVIPQAKVNS